MTAVDPVHRPVSFGYFLVPNAASPLIATAQRVERLGLDYVGIQDHPYQRNFADTWSLMAMIAASTTTLRIFPDVANLPLRPPAVMAKAAATIDLLSGGRFELGLGAGGFWDAIEAYGGPRRGPARRSARSRRPSRSFARSGAGSAICASKAATIGWPAPQSGPVPPHEIGIWLGVYGPRALELTGRAADGWIPSFRGDIGQIAQMSSRLDDAVAAAGLLLGAVRRVLNVSGTVTDGSSEGMFRGPVTQWVDELAEVAVSYGFDTFVFWGEGDDQLDRFAQEVVPAARERLVG